MLLGQFQIFVAGPYLAHQTAAAHDIDKDIDCRQANEPVGQFLGEPLVGDGLLTRMREGRL